MAHAQLSHALLPGCALGSVSGSQFLMFLKRKGVENTKVYGGVDAPKFPSLGVFGLQCAFCGS